MSQAVLQPSVRTENPPLVRTRTQVAYLNVLRALAIVAVVVLHVASPICFSFSGLSSSSWWAANLLNSATHWCVPVFLMVSGALLLDPSRTESAQQFYTRRFTRVGVPLLFWSAFYFAWNRFFGHEAITPRRIVSDLIWGKPYYHLHFMFLITGLYLFTPMLRTLIRNTSRRQGVAATAMILVIASYSYLVRTPHDLWRDTAVDGFAPYLGFYLAGYYLASWRRSVQWVGLAWAAILATIVITVAGIGWCKLTGHLGWEASLFLGYFSPAIAVMALSVFLIAKHSANRWLANRQVRGVLASLASASLGIYLTHPVFLDIILLRYPQRVTTPNAAIGILLCAGIVLLAAWAATIVLARIPGIRRTVG